MKQLGGKRALVTGAASGIGLAISRELARRGTSLLLCDMDAAGAEAAVVAGRALGVDAEAVVADLARPEEVERVVLAAQGAGIDLLVNNAGITYIGPAEAMSFDQWEQLAAVNLAAPLQLTIGLLPLLTARPEAHVLNVCSFAGLVEHFHEAAYSLTKTALVGFSESLRIEYRGTGLGVTALCPGMVRTSLRVMTPGDKPHALPPGIEKLLATPDEVAATAIEAILRNRGVVVCGFPPHALWLLKRWAPAIFDRLHGMVADGMLKQARADGAGRGE